MIAKAAVKIFDNKQKKIIIIPCHRHSDVNEILYALGYKKEDYETIEQGFLDENDSFFNRRASCAIAEQCGQIVSVDNPVYKVLYTEDLW